MSLFELRFSSKRLKVTIRAGETVVNWDGILRAKEEERQRIKDERVTRKENYDQLQLLLDRFGQQLHARVKETIDERNASIPLPGNRISLSVAPDRGFLVSHKAALLRVAITDYEDQHVVKAVASGIEADGSKTKDERYFALAPAGGEITVRRYRGFGHGNVVTLDDMSEELLSTFAAYMS